MVYYKNVLICLILVIVISFIGGFCIGVAFENTRDLMKIEDKFNKILNNDLETGNLFRVGNNLFYIYPYDLNNSFDAYYNITPDYDLLIETP